LDLVNAQSASSERKVRLELLLVVNAGRASSEQKVTALFAYFIFAIAAWRRHSVGRVGPPSDESPFPTNRVWQR
jgi:hypothetical protein